MLLFDFNQVAISNIMEFLLESNGSVDEEIVRGMILNTIRACVKKFKEEYGKEVIIACDSRGYWRKDLFQYYKASRKKLREATGHDWNTIFSCMNKIKEELSLNSPYKVIEVENCEADDIISVLTQKYHAHQKIMIISSDKDFAQLQRYPGVKQYSPIHKKDIVEHFPEIQLKQLIIRGDSGDGIPNILSVDNSLVDGIRQKPITEKRIIEWLNMKPEEFCDEVMLQRYRRNESLIDLTKIPQNICDSILEKYDTTTTKNKTHFMTYLAENRLMELVKCIGDF